MQAWMIQQRAVAALRRAEWSDFPRAVDDAVAVGGQRVRRALSRALEHPHAGFRRHAIRGLGELGDPRAIPALIAALQDHDSGVRAATAAALGGFDDPRVQAPLRAALQDRRAVVLAAAAQAAGCRGITEALPRLRELTTWSRPAPHPDYQPESWLEERLEQEQEAEEDEAVRRAAAEAIRLLTD